MIILQIQMRRPGKMEKLTVASACSSFGETARDLREGERIFYETRHSLAVPGSKSGTRHLFACWATDRKARAVSEQRELQYFEVVAVSPVPASTPADWQMLLRPFLPKDPKDPPACHQWPMLQGSSMELSLFFRGMQGQRDVSVRTAQQFAAA